MKKFVGLRTRKDNYLIDDGGEEKKQKAQKTVIKRKLKFKHYNCFEAIQLENKIKNLDKNMK